MDSMQAGLATESKVLYSVPGGGVIDCSLPFGEVRGQTFVERMWRLPDCLGQGHFRRMEVDNGVCITMSECRIKQRWNSELHDAEPGAYFFICLRGGVRKISVAGRPPLEVRGGTATLFFSPEQVFVRQVEPGEMLQNIIVKIPLAKTYHSLENDALETAIQNEDIHLDNRQLCPGLRATLLQLFRCGLHGTARRLFLEGAIMQFLAHWIQEDKRFRREGVVALAPDEADRIWAARQILMKDICSPPSLVELAMAVGLTHTRLNMGFRAIFGSTVFEYLRTQRLDRARLLIMEGRKNMTEIAYETGFSTSSHFTYAFRKQYGIAPTQYK